MRNARVFKCPNCGGAVDAQHCSGCGSLLGLEPVPESDYLKCPRCNVDFDAFCGSAGRLRDCSRCGGQFVEHALLRDLIEGRESYDTALPRKAPKSNPLDDPVHYVPCPECRTMMTRKNFGGSSGVIVDVCARHGTWFDRGELPLVLAFVESGGLAVARRREIEEAERRRAAASAMPLTTAPMTAFEDAEALSSLLDFITALFGNLDV